MGSCTGHCCTKDTNTLIIQIKKTEFVAKRSEMKGFTPEEIQQVVTIQAFMRGYLVRKSLSTQMKASSIDKSCVSSPLQKKVTKYRSLLVSSNSKVNRVTYLSNEQKSPPNEEQSDETLKLESNFVKDPPRRKSRNAKLELNALISSNSIDVNSQKSQTFKSSRIRVSLQVPPPQMSFKYEDGESISLCSRFSSQGLCFEPADPSDALLVASRDQVNQPMIYMKNGDSYEGAWCNGRANGYGRYVFADKSEVTAIWIDNKANGQGTFIHPSGDVFTGSWKNNQASGYGMYKYANGTEYDGQWRQDLPHGHGRETYLDQSEYVGDFFRGKKHGQGTLMFQDRSYYKGQFQNNEMEGFGIFVWADGRTYEGEWIQSRKHGRGKMTWSDGTQPVKFRGRQYNGHYINDKKCGHGIFTWMDGRRYEGQWDAGVQHGLGEFYLRDKLIKQGRWVKGKYQN